MIAVLYSISEQPLEPILELRIIERAIATRSGEIRMIVREHLIAVFFLLHFPLQMCHEMLTFALLLLQKRLCTKKQCQLFRNKSHLHKMVAELSSTTTRNKSELRKDFINE